jgi:hypothetical protein
MIHQSILLHMVEFFFFLTPLLISLIVLHPTYKLSYIKEAWEAKWFDAAYQRLKDIVSYPFHYSLNNTTAGFQFLEYKAKYDALTRKPSAASVSTVTAKPIPRRESNYIFSFVTS